MDHPAEQLLRHNVTGILDGALRTSNARYDDSEVLARIDVTLLEVMHPILMLVLGFEFRIFRLLKTIPESISPH